MILFSKFVVQVVVEYIREVVNGRYVYYCIVEECTRKYYDWRLFNMHRFQHHHLPTLVAPKHFRTASGREPRQPAPPPDKLKEYLQKKVENMKY